MLKKLPKQGWHKIVITQYYLWSLLWWHHTTVGIRGSIVWLRFCVTLVSVVFLAYQNSYFLFFKFKIFLIILVSISNCLSPLLFANLYIWESCLEQYMHRLYIRYPNVWYRLIIIDHWYLTSLSFTRFCYECFCFRCCPLCKSIIAQSLGNRRYRSNATSTRTPVVCSQLKNC